MELRGNLSDKKSISGNVVVPNIIHGKSAYEIAVINGFEGTEAEWLASLKGEKGEQGIQGERGAIGPQGEQGADGEDYVLTEEDKQEIAEIVKPQIAEELDNKPTIYEGTVVTGYTNLEIYTEYIIGKTVTEGINTIKYPVDNLYLNLKVGDLYYNTEQGITYLCLYISVSDEKTSATVKWKNLNIAPDTAYTPNSVNAQSGKAVAQALENYHTADVVDDMVEALKPKAVAFANGATLTLADNTEYTASEEITSLTVVYPDTDFICSLNFTLASEGDIVITLPESKYIGGVPSFANGETWELNIRDGVVVGGLVE